MSSVESLPHNEKITLQNLVNVSYINSYTDSNLYDRTIKKNSTGYVREDQREPRK